MARLIIAVAGAYFVAVGAVMFVAPDGWYLATRGVAETGPYNMHFVLDVALVFAVTDPDLILGALRRDRSLLLAGAAWPALHALFHIWVWLGRGLPVDGVAAANLFAIQLPAWLALIAALKTNQTETIT